MKKTCSGCYAVTGNGHPRNLITEACKCSFGYKTTFVDECMRPLEKCTKVKSWKAFSRIEMSTGK